MRSGPVGAETIMSCESRSVGFAVRNQRMHFSSETHLICVNTATTRCWSKETCTLSNMAEPATHSISTSHTGKPNPSLSLNPASLLHNGKKLHNRCVLRPHAHRATSALRNSFNVRPSQQRQKILPQEHFVLSFYTLCQVPLCSICGQVTKHEYHH